MTVKKVTPAHALRLLLDEDGCRWATDIAKNPAFHRANARSRGYGGKRVVDAYRERAHEGWTQRLMATLALPPSEFVKEVPPLVVTTINREGSKAPWGPWGDPLYDSSEEDDLYGLLAKGKARQVAIPCPWRRMLDNAVEPVLQATSEDKLSASARAYRKGYREVVRTVIRELQGAVKAGEAHYWARLDIRDFFPSMPWDLIETTLMAQGYPEEFIAKTMALVKAPLETRSGKPVKNTSGSQAGTRISGVLANLVLTELDKLITSKFKGKIRYWRYADDMIITGGERQYVVAATRLVNRWCGEVGLSLKGPSKRQPLSSMVHKTAKKPIMALGAVVTKSGVARPQRERLEAFLKRLNHRVAWLADDQEVIVGISQYDRFDKKGRYVFDGTDLQRMIDQFVSYWGPINRTYTEEFLRRLRFDEEHTIDPDLPGMGLSNTWVAWLPSRNRPDSGDPSGEADNGLWGVSGCRSAMSTIGALFSGDPSSEVQPEALTGSREHDPAHEWEWEEPLGDSLFFPSVGGDLIRGVPDEVSEPLSSLSSTEEEGFTFVGEALLGEADGDSSYDDVFPHEQVDEAPYSFERIDSGSPESEREYDLTSGSDLSRSGWGPASPIQPSTKKTMWMTTRSRPVRTWVAWGDPESVSGGLGVIHLGAAK